MLRLRKITYFLLISMLFIPLWAIVGNTLGLPRGITFYYQLIFWAYGFFFVVFHISQGRSLKFPKMLYFLLCFILYQFIWTFYNGDIERRGLINIIGNNVQLSTFFVILIIYNTQFSERFIKTAIKIIKVTVIAAATVSVIQVFQPGFLYLEYGDLDLRTSSLYTTRRPSFFGYNPNELGLGYIPLLSSMVGVLYLRKNKIPFLFLALGGLSALLTNGRYIMVGFLLLSIQFLVIYKLNFTKLIKYLIIAILLFFTLSKALTYLGYDFEAWYQERLFAEGSIEETTRYKAIQNFLYFFPQYYVFGNGEGLTDEIKAASRDVGSSQIHVGYLSALVYFGIVGSLFLFGFWYLVTKEFYKTAKKTGYWGSFFAMLTYLWAQATLVHFAVFFYGLIFAFVFDKYFHAQYIASNQFTNNK